MKNFLINSLVLFFLVNCASGPAIVPGKGAVYGKISAQSHKDIIAKAVKSRKLTLAEKRLIREYNRTKEDPSEIESLGTEVIDDKKIEVETPLKLEPEIKTGDQPPAQPKANQAKDEQKNENFGPLFGSKSK